MAVFSYFTFGGVSSLDFGLRISEPRTLQSATRDISVLYVPGRNGAIIQDEGAFHNVDIAYNTWIETPDRDAVAKYARAAKAWLLSNPGEYRELCDTYDPDYCRMACCINGLDIDRRAWRFLAQEIVFSCAPYLYLRTGLLLREISTSGTSLVFNPEAFPSNPYFKLYGNGDLALTVNETEWTFSGITDYVEIDAETKNTFKGTQLLNSQKTGSGYPVLLPGTNEISVSASVSRLEMKPRWCTL